MKKIISWGMMLAAAFTLTNCAKEIDAPVQEPETVGYPFEIIASTVDTKTVNDVMSTKWATGDKINVFHALGDDTEYVNDGAFTVSNVEAGIFTGTITAELDVEEEYDWYVLYPYNAKVTTPGSQTAGYTYIGYSTGLNQTGYNSMASLKGSVCPLYGTAKYAGVRPEITMNHLSSIIAINVTNQNEEPLTITTASFTAPEDIVGSYFIDITGESVVYTPSAANYVKNTAVVNVTSGATALAKGGSAILYAAIKPFTAAAGQKLTLSVNGYSKEIELTKDVTFTAGKIKTLNFGYDKEDAPSTETSSELEINFSSFEYANGASVERVDVAPISVEFAKGTNASNTAKYYTTGAAVRVYGGNTFTISTLVGKIIKVDFTFASGEDTNSISADSGTYSVSSWSGAAKNVKFTIGGTTGHRRIQKIKVTYDTLGEAIESVQLDAPEVTCTAETSSSLAFSWGAVEYARAYEVSFNGTSPEIITATTYSKTDLDSETEYQISVKAVGDGIFYTDSEVVTCKGTTSAVATGGGTPVDETLSFADKAQRTSFSSSKQVWQQNGITFTNDKASSTSAVADYAKPVRLYAKSKVTVDAEGEITKIVFDCNSNSYATAMKNSIGTVSGATVSVSSDKVTVTFASSVDAFVVSSLTAQVRLDSITVTYLQ